MSHELSAELRDRIVVRHRPGDNWPNGAPGNFAAELFYNLMTFNVPLFLL